MVVKLSLEGVKRNSEQFHQPVLGAEFFLCEILRVGWCDVPVCVVVKCVCPGEDVPVCVVVKCVCPGEDVPVCVLS